MPFELKYFTELLQGPDCCVCKYVLFEADLNSHFMGQITDLYLCVNEICWWIVDQDKQPAFHFNRFAQFSISCALALWNRDSEPILYFSCVLFIDSHIEQHLPPILWILLCYYEILQRERERSSIGLLLTFVAQELLQHDSFLEPMWEIWAP